MAIGHFQLLMTFLSKTRETTLCHLFDYLLIANDKRLVRFASNELLSARTGSFKRTRFNPM